LNKQEEILKSALKLFVEFGFHNTPTSKIAKEAGVANGTLFHYYKTKEDLILALYTSIKSKLSIRLYASTDPEKGYKELLETIYMNTLNWAREHPQEFYFTQQFNTSPFLSLVSSEEITRQAKPHLELIELAIQQKAFKNLPPYLLFILINNHMYGVSQYLSQEELSEVKRKKLINDSFDLLWDMVSC
jgi:AcrR family transcriptional regulator